VADSNDAPDGSPLAQAFRDEYAPLAVRGGWLGGLSMLLFVAAVGARFWVGAVAPAGTGFFRRAFLTSVAVPIISGIGLLIGLVGMRLGGRGATLARLGVWLNLVVVVLGSLLLAAFFWIFPNNWSPITGRS
jgi:hypothetical protein